MDCEWSAWKIGECSVTCGGGTRTNTRSKTVEENNYGVCIGEPIAKEDCNNHNCDTGEQICFTSPKRNFC